MTAWFEPGAEIVVRYIVRGRLWSAVPWIVIDDRPDRHELALAHGTRWMCPVGADGNTHIHLQASGPWTFEERTWNGWSRSIGRPGAGHVYESYGTGAEFHGWKINLEAPKRRTPIGFDTTDHYLDVRIAPDRTWRWDDEDEAALAIELGIFTPEGAESARREGEIAIAALERGDPVFDELAAWEPPFTVRPARLPHGWDSLPLA